MNNSGKHRSISIFLSTCWCILAAAPLLFWSRATIHLTINSYHTQFFDSFFSWITNLGDGWSVVPIVFLLAFFTCKDALTMASANILSGVTTQFLKTTIFSNIVRPLKYFEGIATLHTVPGIKLYSFQSFPSGHAATVFTICTILALHTTSQKYQCILFFIAVITAFSRVYLSQHFLHDVAAGSMIGLVLGISVDRIINAWANKQSSEYWLNRSILCSRKKVGME